MALPLQGGENEGMIQRDFNICARVFLDLISIDSASFSESLRSGRCTIPQANGANLGARASQFKRMPHACRK
jgi:hypothetical protein